MTITSQILVPKLLKNSSMLVAAVDYFEEIQQLKSLLDDVRPDIGVLIGEDTKVLVAACRGMSIGSTVGRPQPPTL